MFSFAIEHHPQNAHGEYHVILTWDVVEIPDSPYQVPSSCMIKTCRTLSEAIEIANAMYMNNTLISAQIEDRTDVPLFGWERWSNPVVRARVLQTRTGASH